MIYLSGHVHKELSGRSDAGYMLTPRIGNKVDFNGTTWAADTGCFSAPEKYDQENYFRWLRERSAYAGRCLFATAPDVVGDAVATLEKSLPVLPRLRGLGYKAALVAQDGLEDIEIPWDEFDCLFLGGSTEWKLSETCYDLGIEATRRGKWVHVGRVNSWKRLSAANTAGFDSADGTFLAFGPDKNILQLLGWLDRLQTQSVLNFTSPTT